MNVQDAKLFHLSLDLICCQSFWGDRLESGLGAKNSLIQHRFFTL